MHAQELVFFHVFWIPSGWNMHGGMELGQWNGICMELGQWNGVGIWLSTLLPHR